MADEGQQNRTDAEGGQADVPKDGAGKPTDDKTITFTEEQQKFMDKVISERLKRADEQYRKERDAESAKRAEDDRIAKLQGEEKVKAEYEKRIREAEERATANEKALRLSEARSELAGAGLDMSLADRVVGKTEQETKDAVNALKNAVERMATERVNATAAKGKPSAPTGAGTADNNVVSAFMRGAGLTEKKK